MLISATEHVALTSINNKGLIMPLEPPPDRTTQGFLSDIRTYRHVDGFLYKDSVVGSDGRPIRHGLRVNFTTEGWEVSPRGDVRCSRATFTALCNSRPGPEGGFVEVASNEEQFLVSLALDNEYRWNLLAVPLDRGAFAGLVASTRRR